MNLPQEYYIVPSELYRLGTEHDSTIHVIRPIDVKIRDVNGVKFIVANNKGISMLTMDGLKRINREGWVWKLSANQVLPHGLKIYQDKPDHMMICPVFDMSVDEFKALLGKLLIHCERLFQWQKV